MDTQEICSICRDKKLKKSLIKCPDCNCSTMCFNCMKNKRKTNRSKYVTIAYCDGCVSRFRKCQNCNETPLPKDAHTFTGTYWKLKDCVKCFFKDKDKDKQCMV